MNLILEQGNLFEFVENSSDNYSYCQCISADFGMGRGIAVEFNDRFNTKNQLKQEHRNYLTKWDNETLIEGYCVPATVDDDKYIFNLVTKRNYVDKPTYDSLKASLIEMKHLCDSLNVKYIAMPLIGCGLDKLVWSKVKPVIEDVFKDTDITLHVSYLKKDRRLLKY